MRREQKSKIMKRERTLRNRRKSLNEKREIYGTALEPAVTLFDIYVYLGGENLSLPILP